MSFKELTRDWWMAVAKNKCQYEIYSEKSGFKECGARAKHVHHIEPEGTVLARGADPERGIALPLCERHHVRNLGDEAYSNDFAFHPDAGEAYKKYHEWKRQNIHMQDITGKISRKIPHPSPFEEMVEEHHRLRDLGELYHAGDPGMDEYLTDKMRNKGVIYQAKMGDKKPQTKQHPRFDPQKKKHWYDGIFD